MAGLGGQGLCGGSSENAGLSRPEARLNTAPRSIQPMFIGAINQDLRSVLLALSPTWRGLPVYVGCSGNFTVERVLASSPSPPASFHGNDVSLYSCALGAYLAGRPFAATVRDSALCWMADYLAPGLPTVATLLLSTEAIQFYGRDHPYHRRMWEAYRSRWPQLHAQTLGKLEAALGDLRLSSFCAGDVVDFMERAPDECVAASFPPTYKSGYERLYKALHAAFAWDEPSYELFTEERFARLCDLMCGKKYWVISRDAPVPALAGSEVACVQTSPRSKPVWVYANVPAAWLTRPHIRTEPMPYQRLADIPRPPLEVAPLTAAQLNLLRAEYLNPGVAPANPRHSFAVLADGWLVGCFAFTRPVQAMPCDAYLLCDLAVPACVPRLSKLVLAAALSTEIRTFLEEKRAANVENIGTTAFTDKPVSMKYRGLFHLHSRKEGWLNYLGKAGRWTLGEGFDWWQKTQLKSRPK